VNAKTFYAVQKRVSWDARRTGFPVKLVCFRNVASLKQTSVDVIEQPLLCSSARIWLKKKQKLYFSSEGR